MEKYNWLPSWYATRLHAVHESRELPTGMATIFAECGVQVYGKAPTEWAQRKINKGVQHCKKCEKIIANNGLNPTPRSAG